MKNKIIIAVAPVAHSEKTIPEGLKNPKTPEEVAKETIACYEKGASLVHLHVRDENGIIVNNLDCFSSTIDLIRKSSDIIIQGSTGGLSDLTLDERSLAIEEPRVQMASLNMGSTNFNEGVYINRYPDIRYWANKMKEYKVVPELEVFDLSMIETIVQLQEEGVLDLPLHFNFALGFKGALSAKPDNLFRLKSSLPYNSSWGLLHEGMRDYKLITNALTLGASIIRVGYEDGFYLQSGKTASNSELVEQAVKIAKLLDFDIATPAEAHKILQLKK